MNCSLVNRLADWWPWGVDPSTDADRALAYLDADVDAETLDGAARVVAVLVVVAAVGVGTVFGALTTARVGVLVASAGVAVGVAVPLVAKRGPPFLATLARTRALGSAASLVGRAALRLRIDPTVERAAVFAANTGRGPLSRSLGEHVDRAAGTPRSGFDAFAREWRGRFPALGRAVERLDAAASAPAAERDDHLDRAVEASLDVVVVGVTVAAASTYAAARLVAPWAAPITAVGLGVGAALVVDARPSKRIHERVRAVESDLDDACFLVGRRVAAGEAVETAIADAAERITGATGTLLADAASRQRRLGLRVADAFHGEHGALATLPSRRAREASTLFSLAASEGEPAGEALVATAEHVEELGRIEREARRELAQVTNTLANTAAVFGPVVGGATVALSARVARTGTTTQFGAGALPTAELGLAVGAYVLWLAAALTTLSTGLTHGLDRTLVGHRVGVALCLATVCYLTAFVGAGLFL